MITKVYSFLIHFLQKMRDKTVITSTKSVSITTILWLCLATVISLLIRHTDAHGRLIEPPSRASAWRYGFDTPPNYNDHELYCGGFSVQWHKNNGKCGKL